jgi:hypothetical protein
MLRCSNRRVGSGSLAFPAPSSTFRRFRPGPRGVPEPAAVPTEIGTGDPHDLGLLFEALPQALPPPLGWAPLVRFASTPPSTSPVCVHSREQAPFDAPPPSVAFVPPSWFLTTSTVYSALRLAGLLRPAAGQGFAAFQARRSRSRPKTIADLRAPSPRRGLYPSKSFPRRQPEPHHCGPLPSCCYLRCPAVHRSRSCSDLAGPGEPGAAGPPKRLAGTGRRLDTVKLRSAEADPHVTDARPATGKPVTLRALTTARGHRSDSSQTVGSQRAWRPATPKSQALHPRPRALVRAALQPKLRGTPRSARITEVTRADLRDGASGQLQGLAPPTSPLCRAAVASRPTPDPSMGFFPLQGPLTLRTSPGLPTRVDARDRGR